MKVSISFLLLLFSLLIGSNSFGQFSDSTLVNHHFKGEIIRAYGQSSTEVNHLLVGIKGGPGDAKIHISEDQGRNWRILNQGKALCDSCQDIQAVEFITDDIIIAGTWKNGLYHSIDRGENFNKIDSFPSVDIRSIKINSSGDVYAATTTQGIQISKDNGFNWENAFVNDPIGKFPAWYIDIHPKNDSIMYGMSFKQEVMQSTDAGKNWHVSYSKPGIMCWDMSFADNGLTYIAGSGDSASYIIYSFDEGDHWKEFEIDLPSACAIEVKENLNHHELIVGSWGSGYQQFYPLYYDILEIEFLKDTTLKHDTTGATNLLVLDSLFINFSWGDGVKTYAFERKCEMFIPNIASPDSDPQYQIQSSCEIIDLEYKLYDRWGELVFKTKKSIREINEFMNSTNNIIEDGVYTYLMSGTRIGETTPFSFKGHITILK
jgi:photosystem II stability/assembly factor-like uncharacterized protein